MINLSKELHQRLSESEIEKYIEGNRKYSLWIEGYAVTGNFSNAEYLGEFEGDTFNDACDNWAKTIRQPEYYKPGTDKYRPSYWGCRIFGNEADARRSFG